jgi:probable HAF family extracellular repeat protein
MNLWSFLGMRRLILTNSMWSSVEIIQRRTAGFPTDVALFEWPGKVTMIRYCAVCIGVICVATFVSQLEAQVAFTRLGDLEGGEFYSQARAISRDGAMVVGTSSSATAGREAFVWRGEELIPLGDLAGGEQRSEGWDVNRIGPQAVAVGIGRGPGIEAFRWRETSAGQGDMKGLGFFPGGSNSVARGVSADGNTVVGRCIGAMGYAAFRWTADDGMIPLPGLLAGGGESSEAWDVSADGKVIVGRGRTAADAPGNGFRWTTDGVVTIPTLPGGDIVSEAFGVSADGAVVVGLSSVDEGLVAYRWTAATGPIALGDLPGGLFRSRANATSADGSVIVGQGRSADGDEATVWTTSDGMRSLREILVDGGVDMAGWTLIESTDVSDDGTKIVGYGTNPDGLTEAWVATIPGVSNNVSHFKVYDVRDTVTKKDPVALKGQFDTDFNETKIGAITHFATPVRKNREPIADHHAHLAFLTIERSDEPRRRVVLRNQFGEQTAITRHARWLLVPSEKVEPGSKLSQLLDHYKVYAVERPQSTTAKPLLLEDQFIAEEVQLCAMMFFAVPVHKRHNDTTSPIRQPAAHLAIYGINGTENVAQQRPVRNQFGEFTIDFFQGRYLCVPSQKIRWNELGK